MEYRDPKRIRQLLIDIEKRVETSPSTNVLKQMQELSVKHEATDGLPLWQFTKKQYGKMLKAINAFRSVHSKHFKDIRWLRQQLIAFIPNNVINDVIAKYRL